jgi:hypothetical protein
MITLLVEMGGSEHHTLGFIPLNGTELYYTTESRCGTSQNLLLAQSSDLNLRDRNALDMSGRSPETDSQIPSVN